MKTTNDYQMFFQGYLEALTDIDGDQREFGVRVKMFHSSKKSNSKDIRKNFAYKEPLNIIHRKKFKDFYSSHYILKELLFVNLFNGANIPKESVDSFRDYVLFHLYDYIDFSFDDARYRLGNKKGFEIIFTQEARINRIFLIMSAEGKKLIFSFYRNKKYFSDKQFKKWSKDIIVNEKKQSIKATKKYVKKWGVPQSPIHDFLYREYNKQDILQSAYKISIGEKKKSKYIKQICAKKKWKLKELIPIFSKGLEGVYGDNLASIEDIARFRIGRVVLNNGLKKEESFYKMLDEMLQIIRRYNRRFQTRERCKKFKMDNKYGYSISSEIHDFLIVFEKIIFKYKSDDKIAKALKKKYKKENIEDIWREVFFRK